MMLWTVYLAVLALAISASAGPPQVHFQKYITMQQWKVRVVGPRLHGREPEFLHHIYTLHDNNTLTGAQGISDQVLPDTVQSRTGWWGGRATFNNDPIQTQWLLVDSTLGMGEFEHAPTWATDYARWLWQVQFSDTPNRGGHNDGTTKQTTLSRLLLAYYLVRGPQAPLLPSFNIDEPVNLPSYQGHADASDSHVLVHFAADSEKLLDLAK